jgi:hypothetical protein
MKAPSNTMVLLFFSNTCKKCLNIIYDFTIIIKSAFFSPGAIFLVPPPPPPVRREPVLCCVDRPGEGGGVGEGVRLSCKKGS